MLDDAGYVRQAAGLVDELIERGHTPDAARELVMLGALYGIYDSLQMIVTAIADATGGE